MKEEFINRLNAVNPKQEGWHDFILEPLGNTYAHGYLDAKMSHFTDSSDDYEELLEELLTWAEHDIWQ